MVDNQKIGIYVWTGLNASLSLLMLGILVLAFGGTARKDTHFSNSVKAIGAYIFLMMLVTLLEVVHGLFILFFDGDPSLPTIQVEGAKGNVSSVKLFITNLSYMGTVSLGLSTIANWGLSYIFLFTVIAMSLSLEWEQKLLEIKDTFKHAVSDFQQKAIYQMGEVL